MANDKKPRAKKELSKARQAAMAKVKEAGSDQEKAVAKQALKFVRFKEVGSIRLSAAVKALKNFEGVLDASAYAWTPEQTEKCVKSLKVVYDRIIDGLQSPKARKAAAEKIEL